MIKRIRSGCLVLALALLACGPAQATDPAEQAAEAVVERLHETLLASMKAGDELDFAQRVERLRPVVERTFHFEVISRFVLGAHARGLDAEQRVRIVDALAALSARQYASHFDRYNGERLVHVETTSRGDERVRVATELVRADGERISLEYVLQQHEGRWGVVNVIADGVSDLALKRAEYAAALSDNGFPALIERLRRQIEEIGPR